MPAAKTVTSTTSARPTISAAAVTAVRCGWRIAFSRASLPGEAAAPAARRARGPAAARAAAPGTRRRTSSAARPGRAARPRPRSASMPPKSPKNSASRPSAHQRDRADDAAPAQVADAGRDGVAHRRHRLHARRAPGGHEARDHRRDDADDEADDDRAGRDHEAGRAEVDPERLQHRRQRGREHDADEHAEDRREQRRRRTSRSAPSAAPAPREAPSTRSSANSFVRCATVTVNVLKIRKPPTSSATAANTSSAVRMKPSASREVLRLLLGRLLARAHEEVAPERLLRSPP